MHRDTTEGERTRLTNLSSNRRRILWHSKTNVLLLTKDSQTGGGVRVCSHEEDRWIGSPRNLSRLPTPQASPQSRERHCPSYDWMRDRGRKEAPLPHPVAGDSEGVSFNLTRLGLDLAGGNGRGWTMKPALSGPRWTVTNAHEPRRPLRKRTPSLVRVTSSPAAPSNTACRLRATRSSFPIGRASGDTSTVGCSAGCAGHHARTCADGRRRPLTTCGLNCRLRSD